MCRQCKPVFAPRFSKILSIFERSSFSFKCRKRNLQMGNQNIDFATSQHIFKISEILALHFIDLAVPYGRTNG